MTETRDITAWGPKASWREFLKLEDWRPHAQSHEFAVYQKFIVCAPVMRAEYETARSERSLDSVMLGARHNILRDLEATVKRGLER